MTPLPSSISDWQRLEASGPHTLVKWSQASCVIEGVVRRINGRSAEEETWHGSVGQLATTMKEVNNQAGILLVDVEVTCGSDLRLIYYLIR